MTASSSQQTARKLRIFSIPGKRSTTQYVPLFCQGLEEAGVEIVGETDRLVWRLGFDAIVLHFPAHFIAERSVLYSLVRAASMLILFVTARLMRGCKLVYVVHDVIPFGSRNGWLLWPFLHAVQHLTDGYMFLSESSKAEFFRRFPRQSIKPSVRIDHGSFPISPTDDNTRRAHRRSHTPDDTQSLLVGFLGSIKAYKGVESLTAVPRRLRDGLPVRLLVAGRSEASYSAVVEPVLAELGHDLIRVDKSLSDTELQALIESVDLVILPYTRGWNSGMAMLVLSAGARLLAANLPIFEELQAELGAPWVYVFDNDPATRAASIESALASVRRDQITASDQARLSRFIAERSFERSGATLRDFLERLLEHAR